MRQESWLVMMTKGKAPKGAGVFVGLKHDVQDRDGIAAADAIERMNVRVKDTGFLAVESGRVGMPTLAIVAATQGVGMGGAVAVGNWWLLAAGVVGLAITMWCVGIEAKLTRREGANAGISGTLYTLLRGGAIKPEVQAEIERRGLEIEL